jgi:hypothetical protein
MRKLLALVVVCGVALVALWAYSPAEGGPGKGRHPHIHHALKKLHGARADLMKAPAVFQGHRRAAIGYINQAIGELQTALKVAPKGGKKK